MQAGNPHIFHDPNGRRWPLIKRIGALLTLLSLAAGLILCFTIFLLPITPIASAYRSDLHTFTFRHLTHEEAAQKFRAVGAIGKLKQRIEREEALKRQSRRIGQGKALDTTIGFYVNWEPNSYNSLRTHVDDLTYVMPEWLRLSQDQHLFSSTFSIATRDPQVITLAAEHHLPVIPVLENSNEDNFQWEPLRQLLCDPHRQTALANRLRAYLVENNFAGINIDFEPPYENMTDAQIAEARGLLHRNLPQFIALLKKTFTPVHLLVTQDLPAADKNFDYQALTAQNDLVIVMLYDQHTPEGAPGPIASQDWIEGVADNLFTVKNLDPAKVILGLGNYCYEWPMHLDKNDDVVADGPGREMLLGPALNIARQVHARVAMDDGDLNPYFSYDDANGQSHYVAMLDAVTAYNELRALKDYQPRGAALWYLGSEDPTIWSFFDEDKLANPPPVSSLTSMDFQTTLETDVARSGDELMQITAVSQPGFRQFALDSDGLIESETYLKYPTPYVMRQYSATGKKVALTFDDGPDPKYTPEILRILKENGVNATFFIIGNQAAQNPRIARQSWADGNELGNHTYTHPHIATVSPMRAELELNATQMLIESLTGRMSMLFRPPYGDGPDSSMIVAEDTQLLLQMERDGYVTVGMNIDPKDYEKPGPEKIVSRIDQDLSKGHVILLHDGGGDRAQTVQALPMIIRDLKAKGYQFVTVSQLMGAGWHDRLFPPVPPQEGGIAGLDRLLFEAWYGASDLMRFLFILAIGLGVLRLLLFGALALLQKHRERAIPDEGAYLPPVTVAIPAYNEGIVVCRTVASVLASDYPDLHVIAVDDGSTDDTAAALREQFADDPRVTIISKENGGKSTALNEAFARATTEIVVCMDADTIFTPTTVRHLVRQFRDPRVGAVAGNVKVGNRINLLTIWQSLEYITSQNFDRQAFAALDSVAVVPGAVGAWRKSAVMEAGGFESNTLAEDTDLTFKIRLLGYATRCDNDALAYTEAPDTVKMLAKQRFRWAFGILQALWKHKYQLFRPRYGAFSLVVMPSMWIFNIFMQALAPVVDLTIIIAILNGQLVTVLGYAAVFSLIDFLAALLAFGLDHEDRKQIFWLFWQRFFYREFMYYIILKALVAAARGGTVGWGKLQRKSTVSLPAG